MRARRFIIRCSEECRWVLSRLEGRRDLPPGIEGFCDRHVHVNVAIGCEPTCEACANSGFRGFQVTLQAWFVARQAQRVVGYVVWFAVPARLGHVDRTVMMLPGSKVLVFGNSCPRDTHVAIIDLRNRLVGAGLPPDIKVQGSGSPVGQNDNRTRHQSARCTQYAGMSPTVAAYLTRRMIA